jgi:hypothetical protein
VLVDGPRDRRRGVPEELGDVEHVDAGSSATVANECLAPCSVIRGSPAAGTSRPKVAEMVGGSSGSPISSAKTNPWSE